jgi:hypothetical protein
MIVTFNGIGYMASINQKGVSFSLFGKTRKEAMTRCLQEYIHYLWR